VGKNNKHLKVNLQNGISGIGFNLGELNSQIKNKKLDLAVKIYLNNWRGKDEIEIRVEDINIRSDHAYFPIKFTKNEITVYDKRGINNKVKYIKGLMNYQKNIAVFVNGSKEKDNIKEKLAKDGYQVLTNQWDKFKSNKGDLILFDKVFNTELVKETHLIMYSVPFSFSELIQIIQNFNNSKTFIHLIINENDLKLNSSLINHNLPDKKQIKKAYNILKNRFNMDSCNIGEIFKACKKDLDCNEKKTKKILQILDENKLMEVTENKVSFKWDKNTELDLSNSVYYNNIINIKKDYRNLRKQLEDKNLFNFINNLTKLEEENNEF
jgi:single-stranded-DNA-specific exonuclease